VNLEDLTLSNDDFEFEEGYEWEGEVDWPFFPMDKADPSESVELENFVHKYAGRTVKGGRITSAAVAFQFLGEDGTMYASVLYNNKLQKSEVASMLYAAFVELNDKSKPPYSGEDEMPYDPKDF
jgi:hypothetical protein